VAEDGKGGWSDQGPTADLRTFPTGRRDFQGVPFDIGKGANSIIVLASDGRFGAKAMPQEVTIPIDCKVEGFFFLHSKAYNSENPVALYQVQYADGTTADIQLRDEENIRDWAAPRPGPFLREKGTSSNVAWTGSCPMFSMIAVYRMLWVNPKPDVAVKAVRFANPNRSAVPILIGLTAAVRADAKPDVAKNLAEARSLFAKAARAIADKQEDKAKEFLKKAVGIDPSLTAAHQALADLLERAGDESAALDEYRSWAQSNLSTPLPYNRIGEILEKRKDYKGALDAYTKSLKIEWNQPPIIEAKERVGVLVK
jgi:tetratricopeptide (TPR) repeat protein